MKCSRSDGMSLLRLGYRKTATSPGVLDNRTWGGRRRDKNDAQVFGLNTWMDVVSFTKMLEIGFKTNKPTKTSSRRKMLLIMILDLDVKFEKSM